MLTILIVVLLIIVLSGFGLGWNSGSVAPTSPIGLLLVVLIVILLVSLLMPWSHGPGALVFH